MELILNPSFQKRKPVLNTMAGEKTYKLSTFTDQLTAKPGDTIKVRIPKLSWNSDECIVPSTLCLEYNIASANAKSWILNNFSRLLCKHLQVRLGDEIVYDNTRESTLELYRDLWLNADTRSQMIRYGIATENTRKLISGDDSGNTSTAIDGVTDKLISDTHKSFKLRLGKILENHGPYSPGNMDLVVEYQITLPPAEEVMKAQSNQSVQGYTLSNLRLGYLSIKNRDMVEESVATFASPGKELSYMNIKVEETPNWKKGSTEEIVTIKAMRKSLTCIIGLFRFTDQLEDETFVYPNIEKVQIEVNGDPNKLFSKGLVKDELFDEAAKVFAIPNEKVSHRKFFKDRFALVLDFRSVGSNNIFGSGTNTENGEVNLVITKLATSKDVRCTFYALSDASAICSQNNLLRFVK